MSFLESVSQIVFPKPKGLCFSFLEKLSEIERQLGPIWGLGNVYKSTSVSATAGVLLRVPGPPQRGARAHLVWNQHFLY